VCPFPFLWVSPYPVKTKNTESVVLSGSEINPSTQRVCVRRWYPGFVGKHQLSMCAWINLNSKILWNRIQTRRFTGFAGKLQKTPKDMGGLNRTSPELLHPGCKKGLPVIGESYTWICPVTSIQIWIHLSAWI
jgi:hypothetical protein